MRSFDQFDGLERQGATHVQVSRRHRGQAHNWRISRLIDTTSADFQHTVAGRASEHATAGSGGIVSQFVDCFIYTIYIPS
jgi:hypothetical protein